MSFANFGMTEEEIRQRDKEQFERDRQRRKETNDYINRLHREHMENMRRTRERNHEQFLRLITGRRY